MNRAKLSPETREALRQALYVDRLTIAAAAKKLGIERSAAYSTAHKLQRELGPVPNCNCGKPGNHSGTCVYRVHEDWRPKCPECGSPFVKISGRNRDGVRQFQCSQCKRHFYRFARQHPELKDHAERLYQLVWVQHEKTAYVSHVLGVSDGTVRAWVKRLKAKHGEVPPCPCGKPGFHSGMCFQNYKPNPDSVRLDYLLRIGATSFKSRAEIDKARKERQAA